MVKITNNIAQTGIKTFVCDEKSELSQIDLRNTSMGSTCYVIKEKKSYILDGESKWTEMKSSNGGSGGGTTPVEDNTYIMDGGEIV